MKRSILFTAICTLALAASAQSSLTVSGEIKTGITHGNGGTTPLDGNNADGTVVNDNSSTLSFSGKEDLGGGLYAGFRLTTFVLMDTGGIGGGGILWSSNSTVQLGGSFGELYLGRALTPASLMVLFYDPWYWDGSTAQVGWQIHQANYLSTGFLRTDNTVGYKSPNWGGLSVHLAASSGEKVKGKDLGLSASYKNGGLSLGLGYDKSKGFFQHATDDNMVVLAGAYDFGVVRPMATVTSSKVNGVKYKAYSVALTAPVGASGLFKVGYGHLDDFDTATPEKESLKKLSLGYQHNLSKRTNLYANLSQAKGETRTSNNTFEIGINHNF